MSCSPSDSTLFKDFEVLWINEDTGYPKDMSGVTLEIYHYESSKKASITSVFKEPYIFTETINDQVNIGSVLPSENVYIDVHFELELNLINTNLEDLECPPNNFVVPGTNQKVAIVNGYKKYALSACELAALVNINASGYTACAENGFITLKSDYDGSESYLQVGDATWNQTLGLVEGSQFFGQDLIKVYDLEPTPMFRVNVGNYVYTNFEISSPPFEKNKRYFVLYRGVDLVSDISEFRQENFIIYDKSKKTGISYSILSETDILSSGISVEYAQMCAMGNFPIGARGPQGFTGVSGGEQGHTGVQGIRGFTGIQGIQGNTGIRGETGIQGIQGDTGTVGAQGETGVMGETGFGIQGETGLQGIQGDTGVQGIQGDTGIQGNQGIQGFTGQMGIQGLRGVTGTQGETGLQGIQGTIGIQGETGIQGIQGTTGPFEVNPLSLVKVSSSGNVFNYPSDTKDFVFESLELQTASSILEQDSSDKRYINIYEDGMYLINFDSTTSSGFNGDPSTNVSIYSDKSKTNLIINKSIINGTPDFSVVKNLSAGSFLVVSVGSSGSSPIGTRSINGTLTVYKLEGISLRGDQGVTGLPLTNIPQILRSSSYILQSSDSGKHVSISTGGVTVNANIFSIGDTVTIYNNSSSDQVITQGTNVTLRLAGTPLVGNRTLAQYGLCTILCIVGGSSPVFVISGGGLT